MLLPRSKAPAKSPKLKGYPKRKITLVVYRWGTSWDVEGALEDDSNATFLDKSRSLGDDPWHLFWEVQGRLHEPRESTSPPAWHPILCSCYELSNFFPLCLVPYKPKFLTVLFNLVLHQCLHQWRSAGRMDRQQCRDRWNRLGCRVWLNSVDFDIPASWWEFM